MSEPSDERVQAIRAYCDRKRHLADQIDKHSLIPELDTVLAAYDEQRARAQRAEKVSERLEDIIEYIRTYDPVAVDDAEAQYPALTAAGPDEGPPSDRTLRLRSGQA